MWHIKSVSAKDVRPYVKVATHLWRILRLLSRVGRNLYTIYNTEEKIASAPRIFVGNFAALFDPT